MKENLNSKYFPILIDLSKFEVIVIGAGNVGIRKIKNLLEFNAKIKVISPELSEETDLLNKDNIEIVGRSYKYGDIPYNSIVFCSTGDMDTNIKVQKECIEKKALLNVADIPELCNFIMPATIKKGDLTVSIGSQGKVPFFVREIKKKILNNFTPYTAEYVEIASELRTKMMETGLYSNFEIREKIIEEFFKLNIEKIIAEEGKEKALKEVYKLIDNFSKVILK